MDISSLRFKDHFSGSDSHKLCKLGMKFMCSYQLWLKYIKNIAFYWNFQERRFLGPLHKHCKYRNPANLIYVGYVTER